MPENRLRGYQGVTHKGAYTRRHPRSEQTQSRRLMKLLFLLAEKTCYLDPSNCFGVSPSVIMSSALPRENMDQNIFKTEAKKYEDGKESSR